MNPRQSFTLCPSTSDTDGRSENGVIPGTIRKDWRTSNDRRFDICPEAGLGIRAAPFELSVSDRDLPRSGTITPLDSHEYRAWVESRQGKPLSCTFPITTNPFVEQNPLEQENGDSWKQRYLESEMSRTESRLAVLYLLEERRRMQLRMLSLEAQLREARSQQQRTSRAQGISDLHVEETNGTLTNDDEGNSGVDLSGAPAADKIANAENDVVVREESPTEKEVTDSGVRMTRSRLRGEETESEENAFTSLVSPSKETDSKADDTCATDGKREQASKKSSSDEVPNVQEAETPRATTRRDKRNRDMKTNATDASQDDEPAQKQTRTRRTKG